MKQISWAEGIGSIASLLVFCTFYMGRCCRFEASRIASNIAFMAYGR